MHYPKRLIEVDLPIKRISAHARREKSIRHGHISTLHIWWARRPLAACRAVICASLWPDPADEKCPQAFRDEARRLMTDWAANHLDLTSSESMSRFNRVKNDPKVLSDSLELRKALLDFIADFANWDNSSVQAYLDTSRCLTESAHRSMGGLPDTRPLVFDPFAGGGSIPLEAIRIGADCFATDLNPVPVLLNKVVLEFIPKYGVELASELRRAANTLKTQAADSLLTYYPQDADGATPLVYLWARTITCEGPGCGAEVPLLRSPWLSKKKQRPIALRLVPRPRLKQVDFQIITRTRGKWCDQDDSSGAAVDAPQNGTVKRGSVTCPCCGFTTPVKSVRIQLQRRKGGARDARLYCVVVSRPGVAGRAYRLPRKADLEAVEQATAALDRLVRSTRDTLPALPNEPIPFMSGVFNVPLYGHDEWGTLFSARQALTLCTLSRLVAALPERFVGDDAGLSLATKTCLALVVDRQANALTALSRWHVIGEKLEGVFSRQALGMVWDFAEANAFSGATGDLDGAIEWVEKVCLALAEAKNLEGKVEAASATSHPLPDDSGSALFTDPPYYNAVPYADLSDFFVVWLKRMLGSDYPQLFSRGCSPKAEEICEMAGWDPKRYSHKDSQWFESQMQAAMNEARRVLQPSGIGVVVFAHKTTAGWEAQLGAMQEAGWTITASWPIDTEMGSRLRAQGSAALASSVHLVCRPRELPDGSVYADQVGDWRTVLSELPLRIHEWMPRLAEEGVVGADAIFACLGPALEIFSRYSRVEKASGEVVRLREYLEQVWAAVSTEALSMIFRDADAAGLESDARFTAIVLWTLGAGGSSSSESSDDDTEDSDDQDDEESPPKSKAANGGYTLEYDAARKIAQGLGVNLEQIDSVVEVKGDKSRLLSVSERAATLFGKADKAEAATKKRSKKATQKKLFDKDDEEGVGKTETVTLGDGAAAAPGVTALDRVHQAMLLFGDGRADALKRFIVEDGVGGDARFWKLAQSLSALYPAGTDEKRWVDGVLARKKSFGF